MSPVAASARRRPRELFGVNYSGAEFGETGTVGVMNTNYIYPADPARAAYFVNKGLRLVRLPITWERLQPQAFGPLSSQDVAGVRSVLNNSPGQKVIIDLHNYARYYNQPMTVADAPKLANVWERLALALRDHPALYGYELMNEPHDIDGGGDAWATIAQAAVDGIRRADRRSWVLVPGYSWQSARFWPENNQTLNIRDKRMHYAAHLYFDADYSGRYGNGYDAASPLIGVERVQPFLDWLMARGATGMMTEYGVPGDPRWLEVLDRFLQAISPHPNIAGGTYWSAGPWWGDYPLSVEPQNGVDKPQMAVLAN